jgi:hypothetical protein
MSRTRTPRDMPAQDPIDRLDASSARLRQVASDLYSADVDEITQKTEVHVHVTQPSQPDQRISELPSLPELPMNGRKAGIVAGIGGLVSAALAIAKALGWL